MGGVRTRTIKRAAKAIIEKHYPKLTTDFETNKKLIDTVAQIPTKRLRNKIAGYTTHLMVRLRQGPVRGISFKLQEEERERLDNYVPEISKIHVGDDVTINVNQTTMNMLEALEYQVPGVRVSGRK
eukprot:TRINITY_DN2618_c0_g1_i2.p1 TRINITY_DN2618_c0_g1~~TRINITY_DN2618_c0_g1_i2.p1  ORF type:complete len:126 (+),score=28.68 TRINITY_DN2618_c0_g1_i2:36-413(+)